MFLMSSLAYTEDGGRVLCIMMSVLGTFPAPFAPASAIVAAALNTPFSHARVPSNWRRCLRACKFVKSHYTGLMGQSLLKKGMLDGWESRYHIGLPPSPADRCTLFRFSR